MSTFSNELTPYQLGYMDYFLGGLESEYNPFDPGTQEYQEWKRGFDSAAIAEIDMDG